MICDLYNKLVKITNRCSKWGWRDDFDVFDIRQEITFIHIVYMAAMVVHISMTPIFRALTGINSIKFKCKCKK